MNKFFIKYLQQSFKELDYPPLICNLPSKGIIYPEHTSFYKTENAFVKKLSGKTEEWGTDILFLNNSFLINYLLDQYILFDNDIGASNMIVGDRDAILLQILISTFGQELSPHKKICNNCENEFDVQDIKIEKHWRQNLEIESYEPNKNIFRYSIDNKVILFKFFTVQDEYEIEEYIKHNDYSSSFYFSKLLYSINGDTNIKRIIDEGDIKIKTLNKIRKYVEEHTPYIKIQSNEITCPKCKFDNTINASIDIDILPINNSIVRKNYTNEYLYFYKQLNLSHADIYEMPIELRKRIIEQERENQEEIKKQKQSKPKQNNNQMSMF